MATTAINWIAADKQYASITDAAQTGLDILAADRTILVLVKWTDNSAIQTLFAKGGTSAAVAGLCIQIDATGHLMASLSSGAAIVTAIATTALTAATWQLAAIRFDRDGNASIAINGVDAGGAASVAALSASINATADAVVGNTASSGTTYNNSPISDLSIHDRLLSDAEIIWIWNSGTPYKLNAWGIAGTGGELLKQSLVSYWPLTSDLTDSHSTNTLTLGANPKVKPATYGSTAILNGSMETVGDGVACANWSEAVAGGSTITRTTTAGEFRTGAAAAKVARGTDYVLFLQNITVSPGQSRRLSFWSRGDGSSYPAFAVYDVTNSAYIVNYTSGTTGTSFGLTVSDYTVPAGCTTVGIYLTTLLDNGFACFDDVQDVVVTDAGFLNGGMERWTTGTNAEDWTENAAGSSTITREDTVVYSGTNALAMGVVDTAACYIYQVILTNGKQYNQTIYGRSASGSYAIKAGGGSVGAQNNLTATAAYSALTGLFTSDGTTYYIERASEGTYTIYIDAVTLTASSLTTTTGLDGATPPAETSRWNPNLTAWWLASQQQDEWGDPTGDGSSEGISRRLIGFGLGMGMGV